MGLLSRTLSADDIASKHIGKQRRYRLARDDFFTSFKGTLLTFYREGLTGSDRERFVSNYVDSMAIFRTEKGQYLVYYIVEFIGNEYSSGRRTFIKVLDSPEMLKQFVDRMEYNNNKLFKPIILSELRNRLQMEG
ncbi:hypothetical protein [Oceanidesulfovibrio marinus]|uniref:Uncharacterized protein n=1 Tax=Oceanidesulfovibrio marinus TaxID=370038 RepID=A0A6P1ZQ90_9BACT|nr:hypothetical protein [Oceanidesulfovibrio marinus]QJT08902.1 hypothetical protein E8L03_08155 [Oceanidesulfovibrio marinus]TVM36677.1 hypothetical protein DQK91_01790 [Oceanidesulfovibrio marinus]